jgi:hypothetical protein
LLTLQGSFNVSFRRPSFLADANPRVAASKDQAATSVEEIEILVESLVAEKRTVIVYGNLR